MGYELIRFIGEVDEEFYCSICTMVLEEPMQSPCEHLFCSECIKGWLGNDKRCPVDRSSLQLDKLKKPARFFRNMFDKLEIKCDFQGCETIVKLEYLSDHLTKCNYSPNAEIICDKGCNVKVSRREYEESDCFTHLSLHYEEKISNLNQALKIQQKLNTKLNKEVKEQKEQITKLTDEVNLKQQQIKQLKSQARTSQKWQNNENMRVSMDKQNILVIDDNSRDAYVQSYYPLEPGNNCFQIKVLKVGGVISIGISCCIELCNSFPPISYHSDGQFYFDKKFEKVWSVWKDGDVIECGIKFPKKINNDGNDKLLVYFLHNGQLVIENKIKKPINEYFPIIWMSPASSRSKVKYLTI